MILDNLLTFTGTSNGASGGITAGAQTDLPTTGTQNSSNIVDLGVIDGLPTSTNGGGARDIGTGDDPALKLSIIVTEAITGGTDLTISLQGAPDNGSGAPGSFTTMWTSPTVVEASLVAGVQLANIDVPRPVLGQAMPRYLKLVYVSTGTHSAGALEGQIVIDRDDQVIGTGGAYSGYPAGLTVAN
jgi:hypothetical protein